MSVTQASWPKVATLVLVSTSCLCAERKAAQDGEMTSDFKIFLASREPLRKYKESQLQELGESQGNKGTPVTQACRRGGHGFFLLTLHSTFLSSLNNKSLAG